MVGKASLSKNMKEQIKKMKLPKPVGQTVFWEDICIVYDQQRADIPNVEILITLSKR